MRLYALVVLLLPLLLLASTTTFAGDDDAQAAQKRIVVLVQESRALKAEGRHDAADVLLKRAHELKARLAERGKQREKAPLTPEQAEKALHGLEMGMEALKTLRREKELKALAQLADELRRRLQEARGARREEHSEIQEARRQLEILRVAFHGLREGEKREAMDRMEHAIHVMELNIEGRRDEEAQEIRKNGPDRGERIELLQLAAKIWDGFGHEGKARVIHELAEQMAAQTRRQAARQGGRKSDRRPGAREVLERRLDGLRVAMKALREAEKERLVEQLERSIHAHEVALGGRKDEEARAIWKQAPGPEQLAELMGYAAHLYEEWGHQDRAHLCKRLSLELLGRESGPEARDDEQTEHLEMLHHQLHEIRQMVERLREELLHLRHRIETDD